MAEITVRPGHGSPETFQIETAEWEREVPASTDLAPIFEWLKSAGDTVRVNQRQEIRRGVTVKLDYNVWMAAQDFAGLSNSEAAKANANGYFEF